MIVLGACGPCVGLLHVESRCQAMAKDAPMISIRGWISGRSWQALISNDLENHDGIFGFHYAPNEVVISDNLVEADM